MASKNKSKATPPPDSLPSKPLTIEERIGRLKKQYPRGLPKGKALTTIQQLKRIDSLTGPKRQLAIEGFNRNQEAIRHRRLNLYGQVGLTPPWSETEFMALVAQYKIPLEVVKETAAIDREAGICAPCTRSQDELIVNCVRAAKAKETAGPAALPDDLDLEELDVKILRALAKKGFALKIVDLTAALNGPNRDTVSPRLHYLTDKGLVHWPPKTRKGATITAKGREALGRLPSA